MKRIGTDGVIVRPIFVMDARPANHHEAPENLTDLLRDERLRRMLSN